MTPLSLAEALHQQASAILATTTAGISGPSLGPATSSSAAGLDYEPDEILVRFRSSAVAANTISTLPDATSSESLPLVAGLENVHLAAGTSIDAALAAYRSRPDVLYAEPNYVIHADTTPNDSRFSELWGMNNTGQTGGTADDDIDAPEAWDIATGSSSVVVGIIDTGVDYNHPDLAANIWTNPGEIAGNGIDDDGDGFIDDVHGYNFVANNGNVMDDNRHGTHVAGTIGAIGNNAQGVAGVNWHVQIMALKFLDATGAGSTSAAISAVNYAAMMHARGVNIKLTSNSWGGGGFSQALQDAIAATQTQGMLFVAAAGNSNVNTDTTVNYPSGYPLDNIISVAASDQNDGKASFSNYGATTVDLAAPGVNILSTTPNNTYSSLSGTSMATPHVAGVAALAWSIAPTATYQQIRDAIFAGVDPINAYRVGGPTPVATGGRLNAFNTLKRLGLVVSGTTPAAGSTVTAPPAGYLVNFSFPIDPASLQPSDLTVDGTAADNVALSANHLTATFTFQTSPVAAQGQHTLHVAAGAVVKEGDATKTVADFTGSFRYDATPLAATSTVPAAGGTFTLPGPLTYDVNFNEAVDPASMQPGDLALSGISGATVSGVSLINGNTTARFTLSGITAEGTLGAAIAAGAITDAFGNPNPAALSFSYAVDNGIVALPLPLTAEQPLGSLIYDKSVSGVVTPAGDTDSFTINVDAGQTISAVVTPTGSTLQPLVELRDPGGLLLGTATATAAGGRALLETLPAATAGAYTISVGAVGNSTGNYSLKVTLNAAEEAELSGQPLNDTRPTAQNLDSAFLPLAPGGEKRAAVIGGDGGATGGSSLTNFENGSGGYTINNNSVAGAAAGFWHLSTRRSTEAGHSAVTSFYYGDETAGNYNTPGQRNAGYITSPPMPLAVNGPITLSFNYVLVHEASSWDVASVLVSTNGGTSFTTVASSTSTTQLPPSSTWRAASFDLSAYAGQTVLLRFNFDTLDSIGNSYEGWYVDDVQVSAPLPWTDYYSFTAAAGDTVSLALKNVTGAGSQLYVEDSAGQLLVSGLPVTSANAAVSDLLLAAAGTYYVRAAGIGTTTYNLVLTDNATFGLEPNNSPAQAQDVLSRPLAGEQQVLGHVGSVGTNGDAAELYKVNLAAGATLTAQTLTPADGPGEFSNTLDPRLRILDSAGAVVATDENSAPDGRNAFLSFTNGGAAALFYVEVAPTALVAATSGEYVLRLAGNTIVPPPFQVKATLPAGVVGVSPPSYTVDFNDAYLATSVQPADLLVDSAPGATGVTLVDGDTITFAVAPLGPGAHTFSLAPGSIQDVQGTPLSAYSVGLTIDTTPPRIVATSLVPGGTTTPGALSYQVTFSKPMKVANLSADDFSLKGLAFNVTYSPSSYSFDASGTVLTINFANLPDDNYTLTLVSSVPASANFSDTVGNPLDGEFTGAFPSGDGSAGGNFVVGFVVDTVSAPLPAFVSKQPLGSLVYGTSASASISLPTDSDSFTVALDAGQTVSVVVTSAATALQPSVELRDPAGALLGSASAPAVAAPAFLQTLPAATAGTYTVTVSGSAGSMGMYGLTVLLNAAAELEANSGATNDSRATAQNISGSLSGLPGSPIAVARGAVLGSIGAVANNPDYYYVSLATGEVATFAVSATGGTPAMELHRADDALLATAAAGSTTSFQAISNFIAPFAGVYYLRVSGGANMVYTLVVTKSTAFDSEANDTFAAAQAIGGSQALLGYVGTGALEDWYIVGADGAGGSLSFTTSTPSDGPNQFSNTLNPHLELYSPTNVKVATGTALTDGRNETLSYQPAAAGNYRLRVTAEAATSGEYAVQLSGSTPADVPFQVASTTPASGALLSSSPTTYTVDFNDVILATSVQQNDLLIDGSQSPLAASFVDGNSLSFVLPALAAGTHTFSLADGSIQSVAGTPLSAFSGTVTLDTSPPRVVLTSVAPGGTVAPGALSYQVVFGKPMNIANLSTDDFSLKGTIFPSTYSASSYSFDATGTKLTLNYTGLQEDAYTLTLVSGSSGGTNFTDAGGNALDGEFSGTFPSGNGTAGGNFVIGFEMDTDSVVFPTLTSAQPPGSLIYSNNLFSAISHAGDTDNFTVALDAGQTITVDLEQVGAGLQPALELRDPSGSLLGSATGSYAILQTLSAATAGTYTVGVSGLAGSKGAYYVKVLLNAALELEGKGGAANDTRAGAQNITTSLSGVPGLPAAVARGAVVGAAALNNYDYYALALNAGDTATIAAMTIGTGNLSVELHAADDTLLASAISGSSTSFKVINNFLAASTAIYYVRITADASVNYDLVVTKNAAFDTEANDTFAAAQAIGGSQALLGYVGTGALEDWYVIGTNGAGNLTLTTSTPSDGPNQFSNLLNPHLELYDPNNVKVATGTALTDGRNETLTYQPAAAGSYRVRVTAESSTSGEYAVQIAGSTLADLPFLVAKTTPANNATVSGSPATYTIDLNRPFLATSIQPGDLVIDGSLTPNALTLVDGDTISFALPALGGGLHTFALAAGSITDVQGTPLAAFSGTFAIDKSSPTVTAVSLAPGGVVPPGALSYQVTFSKPMKTANLTADDFSLKGNGFNVTYAATSSLFDLTGTILTLNYASLPEDSYTLTLVSGSTGGTNFTDTAGNALDGEFSGTLPSGNGAAGGDFVVTFTLDAASIAFPTPLAATAPLGSLIYSGIASGVISPAGDSDSLTLPLDAGQMLTIVVTPAAALAPAVEVRDPAGALLASGTAAAGNKVVLQTVPVTSGGTYTIKVAGGAGTIGSYSVAITLNAALEAEANGGANNDTLATAQNMDGSLLPLGLGSKRLAVVGAIGAGSGGSLIDFESGVLPASFTTYASNSYGRIRIMVPNGTGNSSKYALLMDANASGTSYALNEAIYHVDLTGAKQATLSFSHINFSDEANALPADFTGHSNGDGVAISDDGNHWHTVLSSPANTTWTTATIDLAAAAATAGMKLGANFQIKFQQYDNFDYPTDGRAFDNIQVSLPDPQDTYQLTLAAGDLVTVAAKSLAGGAPSFQLLDSSGAVLTTGAGGATNVDKIVTDFLIPASGSYYLAVTGSTGASYSLLATVNAALDAEPNDSFATAQPLGGDTGVLGSLTANGTGAPVVVPAAMANKAATGGFVVPFGAASNHYQELYSQTEFSQAGTITALRFRRSTIAATFSNLLVDAKINLSYAATTYANPSPIFANNVGANVTTVFDGQTTISSTSPASDPEPFEIVINLTTPFTYDPTKGDLLLDMLVRNAPGAPPIDCSNNGMTISYVYAPSLSATSGTVVPSALITRFDMAAAAPEDWYSLAVAGSLNAINLQTSTPGDGPGEFNNQLNPHLELYDPANTLVATGTLLGDGRNEAIHYQPLVAGNYRVRVSVEGTGSGEYLLTRGSSASLLLTSLTATSPVTEGGATSLSGSFSDPDPTSTHTVVIDWGPGEASTTLPLAIGATTFSATHTYSDDNPTGTSSDILPVLVTVTNDASAAYGIGRTAVTVKNAPPTFDTVPASVTINENDTATITGTFLDPGLLDTHTVTINWGGGTSGQAAEGTTKLTTAGPNPPGTSLVSLGGGMWQFTAWHKYLDDNPSGSPSDVYQVGISLADDDGGSASGSLLVLVQNVLPTITGLAATPIQEGQSTTLTGTIADIGTLDKFTIVVDWGNGTQTLSNVAAGPFQLSRQYLDNSAAGSYPVTVTVTDDDGGSTSASTTVAVANVAPTVTSLSPPAAIDENDSFTLTGKYHDAGPLDKHTVVIDWSAGIYPDEGTTTLTTAGPNPAGTSLVSLGNGDWQFTASHTFLDDNPSGTPSDVFTVQVNVNDNTGDTGSGSTSVTVKNVAPVISALPVPSLGTLMTSIDDPTNPFPTRSFGAAIAADSTFVIVGSPLDDSLAPDAGTVDYFNMITGAWQTALSNPSPDSGDQFGAALAASGTAVVVGAPGDDAFAVDGGAAYIFDELGGTLLSPLIDPGPAGNDRFGAAVAIAGNLVAVGAPGDGTMGPGAGAVYLFDAQSGSLLSTLVSPAAAANDGFGSALAVIGSTVLIGASGADAGAVDAGAAYLFNAATGNLLQVLNNPAPAAGDAFGAAVAVLGSRIAIGAPGNDGAALDAGAAYLYNSTGQLLQTLHSPAPAPADRFGTAVSLGPKHLLVGAPGSSSAAPAAGAVDVFDEISGAPLLTIPNPAPAANDQFGQAVVGDGLTLVVGVPHKHSAEEERGAAYVFGDNLPAREGDTYTFSGLFEDRGLADTHTVTIDWGGGVLPGQPAEGTTVLTTAGPNPPGTSLIPIASGAWQFTATHVYQDDNPPGTGLDTYQIRVTVADDDLGAATATATVGVLNVPPTPAITSVSGSLVEGSPIVAAGDATDPAGSGDVVTYGWQVLKAGQSVALATGSGPNFTFTPDDDGLYRLELTATDDDGGAATVSQTITVANLPPQAADQSLSGAEDTLLPIALAASDVPADVLTYSIMSVPQHGKLSGEAPNWTYLPDPNFSGDDAFTWQADDGHDASNLATASITVLPVNDSPSFQPGAGPSATDESGPQSLLHWASQIASGPADEALQQLHFVVVGNTNAGLFASPPTVAPDGTLAFTPRPNVQGSAQISLVLADDGGTERGGSDTSAPQSFTINVAKPHPWHNAANPLDVTGPSGVPDGQIVPGDVLTIINYINSVGPGPISSAGGGGPPYLDTTGGTDGTGDNQVAPADALIIINYINTARTQSSPAASEGEAAPREIPTAETSPAAGTSAVDDNLLLLLSLDLAAQPDRRRR